MSNTELPPGWTLAPLGEIVDVLDHQRVPVSAKEREARCGPVPYYGAAGQVGWIDEPLFEEELVLLGEDGIQFFDSKKPKAYLISGPSWVNNHAHVLRATKKVILSRYLMHFLNYFNYEGYANGTTRLKLTKSAMTSIPVPIPPLAEQEKIVEVLEDHLSRLDVGTRDLEATRRKLAIFRKTVLFSLVPELSPESWEVTTVGEAGSIDLGRQRHPDWHHGPEMHPYLRVANVFEDRIDTADVMEMDFSGVFERYKLEPGDVLLNEGQSPHLVGRPALYRGHPSDVAFTNSLLRFRARPDVLPEWALMVFRRHLHARRFMQEVRITTNIAHLSAKRLKTVEFPIPPLEEQKRLVQRCEELLTDADVLERALRNALVRAQSLRKSLLGQAFSGALVPQDPEDESASAQLDRIRSERAPSGNGTARRARRPRKTVGATKPALLPRSHASATSVTDTAVQQEFEL